MKMKMGRFIRSKSGSSFLRPLRRSRHLNAQMGFFAKMNVVRQTKYLGDSTGSVINFIK